VTIHYDPMVSKLIVWGRDREQAMTRLERALLELRMEGIETTVPLFRALLRDDDFRAGRMDIAMLDRKLAAGELQPPDPEEAEPPDLALIAAALAHHDRALQRAAGTADASRGEGDDAGAAPKTRRAAWAIAGRREAVGGGAWS
jgi:acetyl/propionyl-CoA carboxylase alpha subunit